MFSVLSDKN